MAEVDDIAERAAVVRPLCSFGAGMLSELRDQICRFGERSPVGHVNMVLQAFPALFLVPEASPTMCGLSESRIGFVNGPFTTMAGEAARPMPLVAHEHQTE